MHYYQFNIGDWGLGTSHLSLEEEAIYLRLINHYYSEEAPIPVETKSVIRRLRLGPDAEIVESVLNEFFVLTDKGWTHNRCEEMLKTYRKTVKKNRANGMKGGRPRADAGSSITQSQPNGFPVATQSQPNGNPNQEPLTSNQEPVTINQIKEIDQRKRFTAPTYDQAIDYFTEKKSDKSDAIRFVDYHASKGWKVGKSPMKDWKAAARTWLGNNFTKTNPMALPPAQNFQSGDF